MNQASADLPNINEIFKRLSALETGLVSFQLRLSAMEAQLNKNDDYLRGNRAGYASGIKAGQDAYKSALMEWIGWPEQ